MSDRLFAMRLFTRVARTGRLSWAARELGLSQPSVSRILAELEHEVGAALITRTTRGLHLTEAGNDYLARIEPILTAIEEAEHAARGTGELRGCLRVATTMGFGVREIVPLLTEFMRLHPRLRMDLILNDRPQDLVSEGIDVALRFGALADSGATARKLGASPRLLVASPAYLALAGEPGAPEDLAGHEVILGPLGVGLDTCTFHRDGQTRSIRVGGRLTTSVNIAAIAAAVAGLGIASVALWTCRAELAAGALVPVLTDWQMVPMDLHAVFPAGRAAKPSARAFAEHLSTALRSY